MRFLATEVSPDTYVNVMAQYHPAAHAHRYPTISRRLSPPNTARRSPSPARKASRGWTANHPERRGLARQLLSGSLRASGSGGIGSCPGRLAGGWSLDLTPIGSLAMADSPAATVRHLRLQPGSLPHGAVVRSTCASLRDAVQTVSDAVLEHHMMRCVLEDHFELYEFPNDLARWCWSVLGDHVLGEQLGLVDPYQHAVDRRACGRVDRTSSRTACGDWTACRGAGPAWNCT